MNYREKEYKEIFLKELNTALENNLISHQADFEKYIKNKQDISNFYVMILSIVAEAIDNVYDDITSEYNSLKVAKATGADLDSLGVLINCIRPRATKCGVELTFNLTREQEDDVTIPAGIIVSGRSTGYTYTTVEDLFFPQGSAECTVQAYANEAGVAYNVIEDELTQIQSSITGITGTISVTNHKPSSGGSEEFNDEDYRLLLENWIDINQRGNEKAFIEYLESFDGIDGYKFVPNWNGAGTLKVILDPGTDEQLQKAYNDLQGEISQASEDIYMTSPERIIIDVYATVDVDIDQVNPYSQSEKEEIQSHITSTIKVFIDGGYCRDGTYYPGLRIGEDFIPYKLGAFLNTEIPELKNITFTYPTEPVTITDEEIGSSNIISIEMI